MLCRVTPWPVAESGWAKRRPRVAVVTVNYNTRDVIARLIYSVRTRLSRAQVPLLVVVDNGSVDGSADLLADLADKQQIVMLANGSNRRHGPALTQAVDWLAANVAGDVDLIWILDSDCLVLRADVIDMLSRQHRPLAPAAVGQVDEGTGYLAVNSLVIDPAQVWREPLPAFQDDGDPARQLLATVDAERLHQAQFPFRADRYVLHRGRATLEQIVLRGERDNPLYDWATDHHEPHWGLQPEGPDLWTTFDAEFNSRVPRLDGPTLAAALPPTS